MPEPAWKREATESRSSVLKGHARVPQPPKRTTAPSVTLGQLRGRLESFARTNPVYVRDGTLDMLWGWLNGGEYARVAWWLDHGKPALSDKSRYMGERASIGAIRKRGSR